MNVFQGIKTHNIVSCGQVQLVQEHDRQMCILHIENAISHIRSSIVPYHQKSTIFAVETS